MFPYKIVSFEDTKNEELLKYFTGEKEGFCQVGPKKWCLPKAYARQAEGYYTMPLRGDDVWICTYPRTGTTVCQELIWLLNNNFDYTTSSKVPLESRFPFYEFSILHHEEFHKEVAEQNDNDPGVIETLASWRKPGYVWGPEMKSPRHLKTHLPFSLLPPKLTETCKVIYVARNPKDVVVSYYHHNRFLKAHGYVGDFERYWTYFENDMLAYSPFWDHVSEAWEKRDNPNILFIFYEELIKDMENTIIKIAKFLNKTISQEQLEKLMTHLQIDNFRKNVPLTVDSKIKGVVNPSEQGFIRKGKVGGNEEFTPELSERANRWINENIKKTKIKFV